MGDAATAWKALALLAVAGFALWYFGELLGGLGKWAPGLIGL